MLQSRLAAHLSHIYGYECGLTRCLIATFRCVPFDGAMRSKQRDVSYFMYRMRRTIIDARRNMP